MNTTGKYSDKDWEELASQISGETTGISDKYEKFMEEDHYNTGKLWNKMGKTGNNKKIDVDIAWEKIYSRIEENGLLAKTGKTESRYNMRTFFRIAAAALIIIGLGTTMIYLNRRIAFTNRIVVTANASHRNVEVSLPDGSKVFLNRNSELSYNKDLGQSSRNVKLKGEAFFDIKKDPSKPFIIDAGNASVKVLGTSFSVLTSNARNAVEVFVKTGKVMVSDNSGIHSLVLEPGDIGTVNSSYSAKSLNENPNYLSWNTDILDYTGGKKLDIVFADLKKVFDIDVVADRADILNEEISTTFYKQPQDSIIQVICATFNFSYKKEGLVYHLSKK